MTDPALLAGFERLETPFYYYDLNELRTTLGVARDAAARYGFVVHYAVKANANDRILQVVREHGFGVDCVSGNEIAAARAQGFLPDQVVFAGVGKSDREITYALQEDIFCFNCESLQELDVLNALAHRMGTTARIALRINPDVNANTHRYITTGLEENKFGINGWELPAVLERLRVCTNLQLIGLHFHIGSQITDLSTFRNLCNRVNEIHRWFLDHHIRVEHLNVGGGLGVDYQHPDDPTNPDLEAYFRVFHEFLEVRPRQTVHFELGRALVARCGNLISRVLFIKEGIQTNFAILDAGMTELIRPALYQAVHHIQNISRPGVENTAKYDVVGPICESSDCFGKAVSLPPTHRGDLVAIRTAGAYGQVMASGYNLRDAVPAVYSDSL